MRGILGLIFALGLSLGVAETDTFDAAQPGFIPPGWSVSSTGKAKMSRWAVQSDKTAPSRPNVLSQLSYRGGQQDYSVALYEQDSCRNSDISVDLKIMSGRYEQSAGVVWRFQSAADYYFALASADRDSVGIYKRMNNRVSQLAHASVPHRVDDKEWNLMKVVVRGSRFVLFFDHRKLIDTQDSTFGSAGKAGLWTKADTIASFDNFHLSKKD